MINGMRVVAIIPARGGSKGIKDKNIKSFCGKPLISYTIDAAKRCSYVDEVIVSTDSSVIANVSEEYGARVPFLRPAELASDTSKTIDAIAYTIKELLNQNRKFDILVLLQPTSPLRNFKNIEEALEIFIDRNCSGLVSVNEVVENPILFRTIEDGQLNKLLNVTSTIRRQDMPVYYKVNGAIYINLWDEINIEHSFNDNCIPYVMDTNTSVDIDTIDDFFYAEKIYSELHKIDI